MKPSLCLLALWPALALSAPTVYTLSNPSGQEILSFVTAGWLGEEPFTQLGTDRVWTLRPNQLAINPCSATRLPCVVKITELASFPPGRTQLSIAAITTAFDKTEMNLLSGFPLFRLRVNEVGDDNENQFRLRAALTDRPVTVTPEPRTKALFFLGIGGCVAARFRANSNERSKPAASVHN
jgi:hypothetical protein